MSLLRRVRWTLGGAVALVLLWAALAPLDYPTRELPFDFPRGAARSSQVAGQVRLTLGVRDVLLLRNRDAVAHVFGQVLVLPGHAFQLPFEQAGNYPFACDAAPDARVMVRVLPEPDPGWRRLRWRLQALFETLRDLPVQGPEDESRA